MNFKFYYSLLTKLHSFAISLIQHLYFVNFKNNNGKLVNSLRNPMLVLSKKTQIFVNMISSWKLAVGLFSAAIISPISVFSKTTPTKETNMNSNTPSVQYYIQIPQRFNHYAEITAVFPTVKGKELEVYMPIWTPGSYLVREFSKNVESATAQFFDKNNNYISDATINKSSKNTWKIAAHSNATVVAIKYRVYCFELSVRTSYIDADQALLNMASVLVTAKGFEQINGQLHVNIPKEWKSIAMTLEQIQRNSQELNTAFLKSPLAIASTKKISNNANELADQNTPNNASYSFPDFDELVDAPLQLGNFPILTFDVRGVPHNVVMVGFNNANAEKLTADMAKICETMTQIVDVHPCKQYTFFVQNVDNGGGGLEHKNSSVLMMSRLAYTDPGKYKGFLGLVAHEYFHLWNVKRIRPRELGPFNYNQENYTTLLWVSEGITSYYDEIAMMRAGFMTREDFLGSMAAYINGHENKPGARVGSVSEMSYDAWIKEYRPNENSKNSTYSYYSKGVVIGALLDAWICAKTNGTKSLDDVMKYLWLNFATNTSKNPKGEGFTEADFKKAIEVVSGSSCEPLFHNLIHGFSDIQSDLQQSIGLLDIDVLKKSIEKKTFGLSCDLVGGKTIIKAVTRNSAGEMLGLQPNDELIAIESLRIENNIDELYSKLGSPKTVTLTVSRYGMMNQFIGDFTPSNEVQYQFMVKYPSSKNVQSENFWLNKGGIQHWLRLSSVNNK